MTAIFDFAALDGLAFAAERGRMTGQAPDLVARDLGPIIELSQFAALDLLPAPDRANWLRLDGIGVFYRAIANGRSYWVCPDGRRIGFLRTSTAPPSDEGLWIRFGLGAQQAAAAAGFPTRIATQLVAAVGEMHSNIYEHSGASATGLVAFRAGPKCFEFVVADQGMGVLESLRGCTDYAGTNDHGEALRLTLTDGVSRFGANIGRGHGFRPLFVGLANLSGSLRFRSGDHALTIDGSSPSAITARTAQKPFLKGLMVSVVCRC